MFVNVLAWAGPGAVDVLVSQSGLPLENYEVRIDQKTYQTDGFGFVTVALEPGNHTLNIKDGEKVQTVDFKIIESERTQLLLNIFRWNQVYLEVHQMLIPNFLGKHFHIQGG